ncbi:MAG: type II secretion system protein GspM [Pseudomonadota bacterium]
MNQIMTWWRLRESREQWLLGVLGALLVVTLYTLIIARPLTARASAAQDTYARALADSTLLLSQVDRIKAATSGSNGASGTVDIEASAAQANLAPTGAVTERNGVVRLTFDDVDAGRLTQWLGRMPQQTGGQITRLQIQRSEAGLVSSVVSIQQAR